MIRFSKEKWDTIRSTYTAFWNGLLPRPLIPLVITGMEHKNEPGIWSPRGPVPSTGRNFDVCDVIDSWDTHLSGMAFLGDAYPWCWPNFGPGCVALAMGAKADTSQNTVWFHPADSISIEDLALSFNDSHLWFERIREIIHSASERWHGMVQIGMTDLGGVFDILSTFLPGEQLLLALYENPDLVKKHAASIETAWWQIFEMLDKEIRLAGNPGWSSWAGIWAPEPTYIFQSDFSYMISPDLFKTFVLPELSRSFAKVPYASYHLDGVGELPHLDHLLADPNLKLVQWVTGPDQPGVHEWVDVFRRILDAGKLAQIVCTGAAGGWSTYKAREEIEELFQRLGDASGLCVLPMQCDVSESDGALAWLERLGVPTEYAT